MTSKKIRDNQRFEETQKGFMNVKTDLRARFDHNKVSFYFIGLVNWNGTRGKKVQEQYSAWHS